MAICSGSLNSVAAVKLVLLLFLQTSVFFGTLKSVGVFLPELKVALGVTPGDIGLSLGLFNAFSFAPGPIVAQVFRRLQGGHRRLLVMTGAFLVPSGLILGAFVKSNAQLAVCLSATGLGSCIIYLAVVITFRAKYGVDEFGRLFGVGKSGTAIGMSLVPQLADYLNQLYGWRCSLMMIGALMGHVIPLTILVDIREKNVTDSSERHQDGESHGPDTTDSCRNHETSSDVKQLCVKMEHGEHGLTASYDHEKSSSGSSGLNDLQDNICDEFEDEIACDSMRLLEKPQYQQQNEKCIKNETISSIKRAYGELKNSLSCFDRYIIYLMIVAFVFALGDGAWCSFLIPHAVDRGIPTTKALAIVYSAASGLFLGRIFGGYLLKLSFLTLKRYFLLHTLLNIVALLSDLLFASFEAMIVTSFVNAFTVAERSILIVVILSDRVSDADFPLVLAFSDVMGGVGMFLGAWISGVVSDLFGTLDAAFAFITAAEILEFFLVLPLVIIEFTDERNTLNPL